MVVVQNPCGKHKAYANESFSVNAKMIVPWDDTVRLTKFTPRKERIDYTFLIGFDGVKVTTIKPCGLYKSHTSIFLLDLQYLYGRQKFMY